MNAKAISFTPEVLKAKLRVLEEYGRCQMRRSVRTNAPSRRTVTRVSALMDDGRAWVEPGGWVNFPFGIAGQILWIRERARVVAADPDGEIRLRYEIDGQERVVEWPDRIVGVVVGHCIPNGVYREGARHFLEVVEVRAERVVEISDEDALLEGIQRIGIDWTFNGGLWLESTAQKAYFSLYDSIYGAGAHARDWCWVYTLKRATP